MNKILKIFFLAIVLCLLTASLVGARKVEDERKVEYKSKAKDARESRWSSKTREKIEASAERWRQIQKDRKDRIAVTLKPKGKVSLAKEAKVLPGVQTFQELRQKQRGTQQESMDVYKQRTGLLAQKTKELLSKERSQRASRQTKLKTT